MALLEVKNVSFSYDNERDAIKDFSLTVEKGEYVALIGRNGSGKSTFAKLLNGLIKPDRGDVVVDGLSVLDKASLFEIRRRVGVVFQNPDNQLVASIVEDDVAFGPENLGLPRKEIKERIDFALNAVGMEAFRKSSPERLSGGQKQRIAIAGVLALKPEVLVLDESTSMLDPVGRREVLNVVKNLNEKGVTVIAITHYMEEVVEADRVIVTDGGKLVMSGTPEEVFAKKDVLLSLGLELPPAAVIADKLRASGIEIKESVLTKEALAEELCRYARKI